MGSVRTFNGTVTKLTPRPTRLSGIVAGVNPDEAVNKAQLDALQQGTIDVTRVELASAGTAAAPSITWDGDTDTGLYHIDPNNIGITANGAKVVDIAKTGVTVTGLIASTTTITAGTGLVSTTTTAVGTALTVGTDQTFAKELTHTVTVATTTTAATAGGALTISSGTGATSGTGGVMTITGGQAGATAGASGGALLLLGGAEGAGGGITGDVTINTKNATGGAAGNVNIAAGTSSSTTIAPCTILSRAFVKKPLSASVATGAAATAIQVVGGLLAVTGGTGNLQLPTAAEITTAIGATPAGTNFDFVVNAQAMTGTNVVTLVVGADMTVPSAPAITGGASLAVTQDTQVTGTFRIVYDTATSCKIYRVC